MRNLLNRVAVVCRLLNFKKVAYTPVGESKKKKFDEKFDLDC